MHLNIVILNLHTHPKPYIWSLSGNRGDRLVAIARFFVHRAIPHRSRLQIRLQTRRQISLLNPIDFLDERSHLGVIKKDFGVLDEHLAP